MKRTVHRIMCTVIFCASVFGALAPRASRAGVYDDATADGIWITIQITIPKP